MRLQIPITIAIVSTFLAAGIGCSSEDSDETPPARDAAVDPTPDALVDAPLDDAPGDVASDAAPDVDAGPPPPVSCETPCANVCASPGPVDGVCADCLDTVCQEHRSRAQDAPNHDTFMTCVGDCGSDTPCANNCCNTYATACAFEKAYEMCTCGFPEADCATDCTETCTSAGLTQACGVCAAQSACTLVTFDYLFAKDRGQHQDCVETCTSSTLTLDECLNRCRDDYPIPGAAYDDYLACVCEP